MTYLEIIEIVNEDKTGIAKSYSMDYLQQDYEYTNKTKEDLRNLFKSDLLLFKQIEETLQQSKKPHEGDFVEYEKGKFARISRLYESDEIQLSNKIGVYVSKDANSQASGCTWDPDVDKNINISSLVATSDTKKGSCWTFSKNFAGKNMDICFEIDFKVWSLKEKENE